MMLLKNIFIFILINLTLAKSVKHSDDNSFHVSFSESNLKDLIAAERNPPQNELDYDNSEDLGLFLSNFFHDSQTQLIMDLDWIREIWAELDKYRDAAAKGDVDYIQSAIDFFQPLQKYDVSAPCLADVFHFFWTTYSYAKTAKAATTCRDCNCTAQFRSDFRIFQWIFDVVDAVGKVPAAVFSGNNLWTGSWQTCRKVSTVKNRQGQFWNGQYCMAQFQPYNRNNPLKAFSSPKVDPETICRLNTTMTFEEWSEDDRKCFDLLPILNLGLCLPDQCTNYDTEKILKFLYESVELAIGKKLICNVKVQCSNSRPETQLWNDPFSMVVLCFVLFMIGLIFFATCYDIYIERPLKLEIVHQRERQHNHQQVEIIMRINDKQEKFLTSVSHEQNYLENEDENSKLSSSINMKPQGVFVTIIMMFSVPRNIEYIMSTSTESGQIRCLHGARFFSMSWVIFGHTYYYICTSFTNDNLLQTLREFPKYFYNQLVIQAPLAVDSFFFFSGLLTSYIFLLKLGKNQIRLTAFSTWFAYFFRRYLRLTPVYVIVMIFEISLFTYISEGPFWRPIEKNYCRNSWWTNLIYLNNFLKQDDPCMGWTWYLANDFQLYAFAPILIILLHKFKIGGVIFGIALLIASSIFNLIVTLQNGYPPAPILTTKLQIVTNLQSYWVDLYVKPYIRCGPYIVGSLVGYLLVEKRKKPFNLTTVQWLTGWLITLVLTFYSIFGLYNYSKTGNISEWWSILYTVAGRPSFAFALGWITFACETNHGDTVNAVLGHKMFIPLSKLTFCAYLLHPILLQLYYLSRPNAFHFTHAFQLLNMFFAIVAMSYAVALIFSLAFEVPFLHVDKLIFGGREVQTTNIKKRKSGKREKTAGQSYFDVTENTRLNNNNTKHTDEDNNVNEEFTQTGKRRKIPTSVNKTFYTNKDEESGQLLTSKINDNEIIESGKKTIPF